MGTAKQNIEKHCLLVKYTTVTGSRQRVRRIKYTTVTRQLTNNISGYRLADMSKEQNVLSMVYKSSGVFDRTAQSCVNLTYRTNINAFME